MPCFLDRWGKLLADDPDFSILEDGGAPQGYTVQQVDDFSARVLTWLRGRGIGREDMVLIRLPHGAHPCIAILGVWKAGAAATIVGDDTAPERVETIARDCACRAVIDGAAWREIAACPPTPGYAVPDDHDAAYAVYTSGSTGRPKGVLHEYGNLAACADSLLLDSKPILHRGARYGAVPPAHFVAFVMIWLFCIRWHCTMCVMPRSVVQNPPRMADYFRERRITHASMPTSLAVLLPGLPPCMEYLLISGEAAHGFFKEGPCVVNVYASSESFFMISTYRVPRRLANTPIGKPAFGGCISLLAEDGTPVPDGEEGELCIPTPYFRGYINLPQETEQALHGGLFHTRDLAVLNADGNYEVRGRKDAMVKIGGNRIEPAEVEAALRRELGIDWVAVRPKGTPPRLCAYFTADVQVNPAALRERLLRSLPDYMVPAFYIRIDAIPFNAHDKLDESRLPEPAPEHAGAHAPYAAPQTETERLLCSTMAEVLETERVGMDDDFYLLGGDSLRTLELVCAPGLEALDASTVFRERTPRRILQALPAEEEKDANVTAPVPLNEMQLYMLERERATPGTTMYNLPCLVEMNADAHRLAHAVDTAVRHHPALLSVFEQQGGAPCQAYRPETFTPTEVEDISEESLLERSRALAPADALVQPFTLFGAPLFRSRVFRTEKAVYLFMDFHHALVDGTSIKIISVSIDRAYRGLPLQPDPGPATMQRRSAELSSPAAAEARRYFEQRYGKLEDMRLRPQTDQDTTQARQGILQEPLSINTAALNAHCERHGVSRNVFFDTAVLLATAAYNRHPRVMLTWTYHGRGNAAESATVGCLLQDCPLAADFSTPMTLGTLYGDVRDQVAQGIAHRAHPYTLHRFSAPDNDLACVFYQDDLRQIGGEWSDLYERVLDAEPADARGQNVLDVEFIIDDDGEPQLLLDYDADRYTAAGMERFKALLQGMVSGLCSADAQDSVQELLKAHQLREET